MHIWKWRWNLVVIHGLQSRMYQFEYILYLAIAGVFSFGQFSLSLGIILAQLTVNALFQICRMIKIGH